MGHVWVVGYDFSDSADEALRVASEELNERGGTLILAHAYRPPDKTMAWELLRSTAAFSTLEEAYAAISDAAKHRLEEVANKTKEAHGNLEVEVRVENGFPSECITAIADDVDADRIVMGTHGRRGLKKFFLGSVTERLLKMTDRPVLVVSARQVDEE